ncbi:EthD family reductase [Leucobacter tenebrionis]|uniref:EthD family reductase n=1 Tax=Leucobacter tenebrionis TaxID=2873270 RepID=UPI001CA721DC|nr:EthD family reductase [Leucobacter tenebrionis]QZY51670.1 EthD family reductase [Leucobacter tenebrionis]
MHKLTVLYPEPADRRTFIDYYETTHLKLAKQLPGMLAWRYSIDVQPGPDSAPAPYFAVFEAEFADADAFRLAMSSEAGRAVAADVPNYATGGAVVLDYTITGGEAS